MLEKGKYYVGDLCYILDKENGFDWGKILDKTGYLGLYKPGTKKRIFGMDGHTKDGGYMEYKGVKFFSSGTANGDGCFYDLVGRNYHVDAGLIGCYPMDKLPNDVNTWGGNVIDFPERFSCDYLDGIIEIGHIRIDTDPKDLYEEDNASLARMGVLWDVN